MKRALIITATLAALAAPLTGVASAGASKADKREAKKECRALRGTDKATREAFKAEWHSFGHCVKAKAAEAKTERKKAKRNAAKECDAERSADKKAFEEHGTNHNKKNAFGKCVSEKTHEDAEGDEGS